MDKVLKEKLYLYRAIRNATDSTSLSLEDMLKGLKELVKYR